MIFGKKFTNVQDACALAHAIVDTVREPVVVLDHDLRVVAANRAFYLTFKVNADKTDGKRLYELGNGDGAVRSFANYWKKLFPNTA